MPAQGKQPFPRSGAKGITIPNLDFLFFFGGYQKKSGDYYNDLFAYDLQAKSWEEIACTGVAPSQRTDHSCVQYDGSMYVFGGYDGKTRYNDLYKCSIKSKKFKWS